MTWRIKPPTAGSAQHGGRHVQRTRIARTASRQAHGDLRGGLLRHRRRARRRGRQQAGSVRRRRPGDRERQGGRPPGGGRLPRSERDRSLPEHLADLELGSTEDPGSRAPAAVGPGRLAGHRLPGDAIPRLRLTQRHRDVPRGQPEADRRQGTAGRRQEDRRRPLRSARRHRGRNRPRPAAGEQAGREGPANGRDARLPDPLPALAALLPQRRRRAASADDRRAGHRRHLPPAPDRQRVRPRLDLRPQPDHRARAGAGDRLQPLRGLPLPRGDGEGRARPGGDEANPQHCRANGAVLLAHRRRGARIADGLPPALPLFDGPRRSDGRAARLGDRADGPAGGAGAARSPGERVGAELPAAARRA